MRGCDEHQCYRFGDFQVVTTSDGKWYIEFCRERERGAKTRTGATERENSRVFKPKMWETPDNPERCPVRLFMKYRDERPQSMLLPESPFYLSINWNHKPGGKWNKSQPVGINIIRKFMSRTATNAELSGRKTNHSARKTTVEKLCRSNIPDSTMMQVTGQKHSKSECL